MPLQEITLTIRFKVRHSPDIDFHLKKLLTLNNHYIVGSDIKEEDGKLVYEI